MADLVGKLFVPQDCVILVVGLVEDVGGEFRSFVKSLKQLLWGLVSISTVILGELVLWFVVRLSS